MACLDLEGRHLVRLGHGSSSLDSEGDYTKLGRVNFMLQRRLSLLEKVSSLAESLGASVDYGTSCENALSFYKLFVYSSWEVFISKCKEQNKVEISHTLNNSSKSSTSIFQLHHTYNQEQLEKITSGEWPLENFPFKVYFANRSDAIVKLFSELVDLFKEIEEMRVYEILRFAKERGNYVVSHQAKIVAMTCTHASLVRTKLIKECNFTFDNLVMEESAQVLELDTFIPLLLQKSQIGQERNLKRLILIGDHNQLPPVVKNAAFQKYSRFDQSLFARFVRLGVPQIVLDAQGRSRCSLSKLFNWRYPKLIDLPTVQKNSFLKANASLVYDYQLIDCQDFQGVGESQPSPYYYQNLGEAEYVVNLYIYLRAKGYPAKSISILTTYNGQKHLIRDIVNKRCFSGNRKIGAPHKISTVDRFQGQQNEIILLSLVRTKNVGHLRDVRRLVVSMSRARLGLYVFCRKGLFENCLELQEVFKIFNQRPSDLHLLPSESSPTERGVDEKVENGVLVVKDVVEMGNLVYDLLKNNPNLFVPSVYDEIDKNEIDNGKDHKDDDKDDMNDENDNSIPPNNEISEQLERTEERRKSPPPEGTSDPKSQKQQIVIEEEEEEDD